MSIRFLLISAVLSGSVASASAACTSVKFDSLATQSASAEAANVQSWVRLSVAPTAILELPLAVSQLGMSPAGSLVFQDPAGVISGGVSYETPGSIALHEAGAQPATFFSEVFKGEHKATCTYQAALQLSEQDYRIHLPLEAGEVFAFGKGHSHHFFVLSNTRPDLVLNGTLRGVDQSVFKVFLSKIQIK